MQVENSFRQGEAASSSLETSSYSCQDILTRDHNCNNGKCLNYHPLQIYNLKLVQTRILNYALELEEALQICQYNISQIRQKKQIKQESKRAMTQKQQIPFSQNKEEMTFIKQIIKKFEKNKIPIITQSAILGLSIRQLNYIRKGIEYNLFHFSSEHQDWLEEYLMSKTQEKLSSSLKIYQEFLSHFKLNEKNLSLPSFRNIIKSRGFSFRKCSRVNFKSTTQENKCQKFIYSLTFLYHIKEHRIPIYVDESRIGNDFQNIRLWQKKSQSIKNDRAILQQRINIIGAISEDLMVYQCFKSNIDAQIIQNFLIRLIQISNEKYGRKRNYIFVLDNASVHKSRLLQSGILQYVCHLFLPPYTPQLYAIEKVWSQFKIHLRKQQCITAMKLNQEIHSSLNQIQDNQ